MDQSKLLSQFFEKISDDPRIGITHIGVYVALLQYWKEHNYKNPLDVFSYEIMLKAKISASTTYHKCIKNLSDYGYITYIPSFKKNQGSKIYMIRKQEDQNLQNSHTNKLKANDQLSKYDIMIQKNLDYLKQGLKTLGLGDKLDVDLEKKLLQGVPAFSLKHDVQIGDRKMENMLHFRKSSVSNMIFLNRYDATLKTGNDPAKDVTQTFYITRNTGIAAKEAFNLLEGRAVCKQLMDHEGTKYTAWQQLDFNQKDEQGNFKVKQFHESYGFNLEKVLLDLPIKEMNGSVHQNMLKCSLERGNMHEVTIDRGNRQERMFIEANPQFKTVNVYDSNFRKVEKQFLVQQRSNFESVSKQVKAELKDVTRQQERNQGTKTKTDDDESGFEKVQKRTRRKGISH